MTNLNDILKRELEIREKNTKALENAKILNDFLSEDEIKKPHSNEEIMKALTDDEAFMIFCIQSSLS